MDNQVKEILKYALILFIITAVSAALLAGVNMTTEGKIAENAEKAEQEALVQVMSGAEEFEALDESICAEYGALAVYTAKSGGETIGYCIKTAQNGYGGEIVSMIGVDNDGKVTGVSIISHSETPGLGANLTKESFREQFIGKGKIGNVVKAGAKENEINAISGATISSKALTASVNSAVDIADSIAGGSIQAQSGKGEEGTKNEAK